MSQSKTNDSFTPASNKGARETYSDHRRPANEKWDRYKALGFGETGARETYSDHHRPANEKWDRYKALGFGETGARETYSDHHRPANEKWDRYKALGFGETGARETYSDHRRPANEKWDRYKALMELAKNEKDYKKAECYREQAEEMKARAMQEDAVASREIFKDKNENLERHEVQIDVHGQHSTEAVPIVDDLFVNLCRAHKVVKKLVIITGHGSHSKDGYSKVQIAVRKFLRISGIPWEYENGNEGRIVIELINACNYGYSGVKEDKYDKGPGHFDARQLEEVMVALDSARINKKDLEILPNVRADPPHRCTNKCPPIDVLDSRRKRESAQ